MISLYITFTVKRRQHTPTARHQRILEEKDRVSSETCGGILVAKGFSGGISISCVSLYPIYQTWVRSILHAGTVSYISLFIDFFSNTVHFLPDDRM